jgi:hypothetical protein
MDENVFSPSIGLNKSVALVGLNHFTVPVATLALSQRFSQDYPKALEFRMQGQSLQREPSDEKAAAEMAQAAAFVYPCPPAQDRSLLG